jgi:hypothetical protein
VSRSSLAEVVRALSSYPEFVGILAPAASAVGIQSQSPAARASFSRKLPLPAFSARLLLPGPYPTGGGGPTRGQGYAEASGPLRAHWAPVA